MSDSSRSQNLGSSAVLSATPMSCPNCRPWPTDEVCRPHASVIANCHPPFFPRWTLDLNMPHQRQTPRSLAVLLGLLMSASACSTSENGAFDQSSESGFSTNGGEGESGPQSTTTTAGEDSGTEGGDGDG